MNQIGRINFEFIGEPEILEVNVFKTNDFEGKPQESEEMKPRWFHVDEIPFNQMWPDDRYWFPLFLAGKKFEEKFLFKGHDKIISHDIYVVKNINVAMEYN